MAVRCFYWACWSRALWGRESKALWLIENLGCRGGILLSSFCWPCIVICALYFACADFFTLVLSCRRFFRSCACKSRAMCLCIVSTDGSWWSGAGDRIASVFECARRLHLCTCVVLGANDSWHLATISGSLISIERFGGGGQEGRWMRRFPLYLTNRCVFDLQTQADACTHAHTKGAIVQTQVRVHAFHIYCNSVAYGSVCKALSKVMVTAMVRRADKPQETKQIRAKSAVGLPGK